MQLFKTKLFNKTIWKKTTLKTQLLKNNFSLNATFYKPQLKTQLKTETHFPKTKILNFSKKHTHKKFSKHNFYQSASLNKTQVQKTIYKAQPKTNTTLEKQFFSNKTQFFHKKVQLFSKRNFSKSTTFKTHNLTNTHFSKHNFNTT